MQPSKTTIFFVVVMLMPITKSRNSLWRHFFSKYSWFFFGNCDLNVRDAAYAECIIFQSICSYVSWLCRRRYWKFVLQVLFTRPLRWRIFICRQCKICLKSFKVQRYCTTCYVIYFIIFGVWVLNASIFIWSGACVINIFKGCKFIRAFQICLNFWN